MSPLGYDIVERLNQLLQNNVSTLPTSNADGNNGDFVYDVSRFVIKANDVWLEIPDVSTYFPE